MCRSNVCFANPKAGQTIICPNKYTQCLINCRFTNQCSNIKVYSGSRETIMQCNNDKSCYNASLYLGTYQIPNGFNINNFNKNKNSFHLNCNRNNACLNMNINIDGFYKEGILINAMNDNSFKNGSIYVKLDNNGQQMQLNCGTQYQTSCVNSYFKCDRGACKCDGNTCPHIYTQAPTNIPTYLPTISPTMEPTSISPTLMPSITPTIEIVEILSKNIWDKTFFAPWVYGLALTGIVLFLCCMVYICYKLKHSKIKFNPYSNKLVLIKSKQDSVLNEGSSIGVTVVKDNPYEYNINKKSNKNMNIYLMGNEKKYNTFMTSFKTTLNKNKKNKTSKYDDGEEYMEVNDHGSTLEMEDMSELYSNNYYD